MIYFFTLYKEIQGNVLGRSNPKGVKQVPKRTMPRAKRFDIEGWI